MIPITRNQIQKIHVLKSRLGWGDEEYRAALSGWKATSCKDLDCAAAASLIQHMELMLPAGSQQAPKAPQGRDNRKKYEHLGHRHGMASPAQLRLIEAKWARVTRQTTEDDRAAALKKFIEARVGVSAMKWLEPRHVHVIVAALNAMEKQAGRTNNQQGK